MPYRRDELDSVEPPACPRCFRATQINWVSVDTLADESGTWWMPGSVRCPHCEDAGMIDISRLGDRIPVYVEGEPT